MMPICYYERVIGIARTMRATLPLRLLTSFATIAIAIAYADASVARLAVLTADIVRMLLLHIQKA